MTQIRADDARTVPILRRVAQGKTFWTPRPAPFPRPKMSPMWGPLLEREASNAGSSVQALVRELIRVKEPLKIVDPMAFCRLSPICNAVFSDLLAVRGRVSVIDLTHRAGPDLPQGPRPGLSVRVADQVFGGMVLLGWELAAFLNPASNSDEDRVLTVRDPQLVRLFHTLFDYEWTRASPPYVESETGEDHDEIDEEDVLLLTMISNTVKDQAIARALGVSIRTLHRRIAALQSRFAVRSRVELIVAAMRSGLIS
ncbi:transcriptional regulator, luxR family [Actinoalloteichus fjordicus]|uniref:Transcriptional regulator, luxR family n=2 Tax=Actinoalloteichus fjordicus TaxID=1612552 RepID=A0AAC9LCS9_9PSEU|nr:transcriptional regulator, luxR family [Actinoalloteichus fjordicus]